MGGEATAGTELVDGHIEGRHMPTGHRHGDIELTLGTLMKMHALKSKLGRVMSGEVGIYIRRNPDTVRAADVLFISAARFQQVRSKSYLDIVPELVAEVLSPDDRWTDVEQKLRDYFSAGVKLVWVINPETQSVFVYRSIKNVQVLEEADTLVGEDVLPGFSVKIADLFE